MDNTEAVLEDVVELRLNAIEARGQVTAGKVKLKVYAPGASRNFGHVRLMKRTDDGLAYCEGNTDTVAAEDIPDGTGETYYLQGVTPSVQARDVSVMMEYDVDEHAKENGYSYGWSKIVRDVMWVNVLKIDLLADTNWDGALDAGDNPEEAEEPGLVLGVNNDDDDGDDAVDNSDAVIGGGADRDDMCVLKIVADVPDQTDGHIELRTTGNSHVRIFDNQDQAVIGPQAGGSHTVPLQDVPEGGLEYLVEGVAAGQVVDLELALFISGTEMQTDLLKVSVCGMTAQHGYYIQSLHKFLATRLLDANAVPTRRFVAGVPGRLDNTHPAEVLICLKDVVPEETVDKIVAGKLSIFEVVGGEACKSFDESIKDDPTFQSIVATLHGWWEDTPWWLRWLIFPFGEPDGASVYYWARLVNGILLEDPKYYWQAKYDAPDTRDFVIMKMHTADPKGRKGRPTVTVSAARIDLDVDPANGDGDLDDANDGVDKYLPGYRGDEQVLTLDAVQQMNVVVEGLKEADAVSFELEGTSSYPGICTNANSSPGSYPSGDGDDDFVLDGDSASAGGDGRAAVGIKCRDFGGHTAVRVTIGGTLIGKLEIPLNWDSSDSDHLPNLWEYKFEVDLNDTDDDDRDIGEVSVQPHNPV